MQSVPSGANEIVALIEQLVGTGAVVPGQQLPPIRLLAAEYGLAPNTVASAYRTLGDRGVIVGRGRHGSYVADSAVIPESEPSLPAGLVDLATGNPDARLLPELGPFFTAIEYDHVLYGEAAVDPALEREGRSLLAAEGVAADGLAVLNGALDGIERALGANLKAGDSVAIEAPGWQPLSALVAALGMRPVPVETDERGMIVERLAAVAGSIQAVVITPRCQNPTGAAVDADRATELCQVLDRHSDVFTIEDDHGGLIAGLPLALVGSERNRWLYIHSVSKSLGPDLRVALVTGDRTTLKRIAARQSVGPGWVSHIAQRVVAAMLADDSVRVHLQGVTEIYRRRRTALIEALGAVGVAATGRSGLNVWVPAAEEGPALAGLAGAGFGARSGERFRMGTPSAIRLSIGNLDDDMIEPIARVLGSVMSAGDHAGQVR